MAAMEIGCAMQPHLLATAATFSTWLTRDGLMFIIKRYWGVTHQNHRIDFVASGAPVGDDLRIMSRVLLQNLALVGKETRAIIATFRLQRFRSAIKVLLFIK